jgi:hypothetical protein
MQGLVIIQVLSIKQDSILDNALPLKPFKQLMVIFFYRFLAFTMSSDPQTAVSETSPINKNH